MGREGLTPLSPTKLNLPELYETISAALVAGADSLLLNRFLQFDNVAISYPGMAEPLLIYRRVPLFA